MRPLNRDYFDLKKQVREKRLIGPKGVRDFLNSVKAFKLALNINIIP